MLASHSHILIYKSFWIEFQKVSEKIMFWDLIPKSLAIYRESYKIVMNVIMLLNREEYLNRLIALKDKKIIKVITGVRRCGKSTLLSLFRNYLLSNGVDEQNIISINFEDRAFLELYNPDKLYSYILSRLDQKKQNYVILDEIQHVDDFASVVDSLFLKDNVDIHITGSNAHMLSGEIATLIGGRYIQISMLPLSFKEYVTAIGDKKDLRRKYNDYIENSSFPYTLQLRNTPNEITPYLDGIYSTIVAKDIVYRKKIADVSILESILRFVFSSIGSPLSSKRIADYLTNEGRKTDTKTVEKYLNALAESYILYKAERYNIKGKQYLKTLEKYYAVDMGLGLILLGNHNIDTGHILENVVYLELIRRGYKVYVGKLEEKEVDFVAMNSKDTLYFQVCATVRDPKTLERELKPLKNIDDHYPKYLLTLDEDIQVDYDGIKKINVLDWLLGDTF